MRPFGYGSLTSQGECANFSGKIVKAERQKKNEALMPTVLRHGRQRKIDICSWRNGMNTSAVKVTNVLATGVQFDAERMHVQLSDGREIAVSLEWFPSLRNATDEQRNKWRLIGKGVGIHWEDLDEDISVEKLLG